MIKDSKKSANIVKVILDLPSHNGNYPLHFSIEQGLDDTAIEIINRGVNLNKPNFMGFLPL